MQQTRHIELRSEDESPNTKEDPKTEKGYVGEKQMITSKNVR